MDVYALDDKQLDEAVMRYEGITDPADFDSIQFFFKTAWMMQRYGSTYRVHCLLPYPILVLRAWVSATADCPIKACKRAYLLAMTRPRTPPADQRKMPPPPTGGRDLDDGADVS